MTHSGTFLARCGPDVAFELLSTPERFAPLLPDFESITVQDATHFTTRMRLAIGRINGHLDLSMELTEASRPHQVEYRGQGVVAGSALHFEIGFRITALEGATEIHWHGEVELNGPLMFLAGDLFDTMGRQNFERTAESVQRNLGLSSPSTPTDAAATDFEI